MFAAVVVATALVAAGGCHTPGTDNWKFANLFDLDKGLPWEDDSPKPQVPARVVGTWTDAVLRQDGQMPQRGFGGRLFFYSRDSKAPVLVDGQLVVYAFDESGRDATDNRPTRRYVFPAEQLTLHESDADLGTSYSFWLPWDEVGGPQTEVSLICRFQPKGGSVVVSEQTRHLLPGTMDPGTMIAGRTSPRLPEGVPSRPAVRQTPYSPESPTRGLAQTASYEGQPGVAAPHPLGENRQMTTTSISLPASFHLRGGVASVRGGPSTDGTPATRNVPTTPAPTSPVPVVAPPRPGTAPTATLARPALPFTSDPPQVQSSQPGGIPTSEMPAAAPAWPTAPRVPASGYSTTSASVSTGQVAPLPGGLTTTVSYRFPGQPAASSTPASSGSPLQTLPAQVAPGFLAPGAATR